MEFLLGNPFSTPVGQSLDSAVITGYDYSFIQPQKLWQSSEWRIDDFIPKSFDNFREGGLVNLGEVFLPRRVRYLKGLSWN
ncbi:hypothetical protein CIB84_000993 [Bambusicola thoracicus]|uniref:Uncharacterized protein n=1 Tax=Bambusicola thoracicus TaxID=9083 RepID=A0A2P4TFV5_BAMTH|nr:hypothetical protein CIB84_000993 [Bambusicola thoracicus]